MLRRRSLSFLSSLSPAGALAALGVPAVLAIGLAGGCGDDTVTPPDDDGPQPPTLRPGDLCNTPQSNLVKVRFSPLQVFLPACTGEDCTTRKVKAIVDPDFCVDTPVTFTSSDEAKLPAPAAGSVTLYQSEVSFDLPGATEPGRYTLTASVPKGNGEDATATLDVVVLDPSLPTCAGTADDSELTEGETLLGSGELAGASIGLPDGANKPNEGSYLWSVAPFATSIACGDMDLPADHVALGPAITFGPEALKFQREIPLSIPINPAAIPAAARLRHLRVLYSGPAFSEPRMIPVADPRIEQIGGAWALSFKAPRLGTYQAVVHADAGTRTFTRRITHRAVIGVSMGGMGSSMFGTRHHDRFDVVAPLGGPAVWGWLMHYIERNHLAGFPAIAAGAVLADIELTRTECEDSTACDAGETCIGRTDTELGRCTLMPTPEAPYEHPQTFNNWWAEYPRTGVGGRFPREEYAQIFRDLALLMGNPNGDNLAPGGEHLPPGVRPDDPSVVGEHDNGECVVWVDPLDGPDKEVQEEIANNCPLERCANTLTLSGYYDDEYNPDGTFPVITVCDGSPTNEDKTPWANAWTPSGPNDYPLEVALAVDYNGNGVRDEMEPIIRSGHEPWVDAGEDGLLSASEPGYALGTNEDPEGDDYDMQYNPRGSENDFHYQLGEPFDDLGMDGVAGTLQQPATGWMQAGDGYDVGENDGVFTASRGLNRMWAHDPAAIIRGQAPDAAGNTLDDEALSRIDLWTDGGTRDIFNFHVSAQHLAGSMAARGRDTSYYTEFARIPGFDPAQPNTFTPGLIPWEDVPGSVLLRYGKIDPSDADIENGSGQHVGTLTEITSRLQTALYFIGSRWQDPGLRSVVKTSNEDPAELPVCEIDGSCTFEFTDSRGRTGPVTVNLPPGYGHKEQQDRTYPVIFMLHGYGQTPEDLGAAIIFINNWMNNPGESASSRMPKAILVYVDGRCRTDDDGKAECIRGNFFTDSARDGGMMAESWWLELMDEIDTRYRTMAPTEVTWQE
ncbi:MAG: hypothetical protein IPG04_23730 [Polyangiaceae bacterium]|nr:hypothetical protein [Polyangiaceae bacterium]